MTGFQPPKVELEEKVMGPIALLRRGSRNIVQTIPSGLLKRPFMSGQMIWKWFSFSGPDHMLQVLAKDGENFPRSPVVRNILKPAIGKSMFLADDESHLWQRRAMLQFYNSKRCQEFIPIFSDVAAQEAERLPSGNQFQFDALKYATSITLSVIVRTACSAQDLMDPQKLRRSLGQYIDSTVRISLVDMLRLPSFVNMAIKRPKTHIADGLRGQLDEIVENRLAGRQPRRDDLLQALIDAKDPATGLPMDPEIVRDNILLIVVAGHETTANTLGWALYLLATDRGAQERARREALDLKAVNTEDIAERTPFISAVLDETMRLYPALPLLLRKAKRPKNVKGCPVTKGSLVFLPIYAMQRSPRNWEDPDAFRPERFLNEAVSKKGYLPFSAGSHSCIGANFATLEMRVVLADLLRRYRFTAVPGKTPVAKAVLSLRPSGGVWLECQRL